MGNSKGKELSFEEEGAIVPPSASLDKLNGLIAEADILDAEIKQIEENLKNAQRRYSELRMTEIPWTMKELLVSEYTTTDGTKVKVNSFVSGSLPKEPEKRKEALEWLIAHDGEPLIKTEMSVAFKKSEHNQAMAIADDIRKAGYEPVLEESVHAGTLQKYARELIAKGDEIDLEKLGLFGGRIAEIKHKKVKP
jgi:hypothetical protein